MQVCLNFSSYWEMFFLECVFLHNHKSVYVSEYLNCCEDHLDFYVLEDQLFPLLRDNFVLKELEWRYFLI